ncbi:MAG: hypothetical protein CBC16_06810 [Verrucomicrobia bacterium TMED56]|nr:MAG: hypothetical protein CBC16_06810 [Verrucomicrobia bacterium TMED56]
MASVIKTKRSASTGAPTALAQGEMAYSFLSGTQSNGGDRLYVGTGTETGGEAANIDVIGGKYFANMLDHVTGTLTASSALLVDANSKIDNFNVDNLNFNGNSITSTNTNGDIIISPNGSGDVDVATSKIIGVSSPTANTDAANKLYVDSSAVSITGDTMTGALNMGSNNITTTGKVLFANVYSNEGDLPSASTYHGMFAHVHATGLAYFAHAGVWHKLIDRTSGVIANLSNVSDSAFADNQTLIFDAAQSKFRPGSLFQVISADAGTADSVVGTLNFAGGTGLNTLVSDNRITIHVDSNLSGLSRLDVDNLRLDGNTLSSTSGAEMFIDPNPAGDSGDLIIQGNLTVRGTTTTINSATVSINDLNLVLADSAGNAAAADGAGITVNGASATLTYGASNDRWAFNKGLNLPDSATGTNGLFLNGVSIGETIEDKVGSLATAGEGIDITYNDGAGTLTFAGEQSTKNNLGIASFDSAHFGISSGHISLPTVDGGTY